MAGSIDDIPCIKGTWGHQILHQVAPKPHDIIVDKAAFNDFHNSMLDKVLRIQGVETPILTGVSSHAGVLARNSHNRHGLRRVQAIAPRRADHGGCEKCGLAVKW